MKIKFFLPVLALAPVALFSFRPAESANTSKLNLAETQKVNYQLSTKRFDAGDIILNHSVTKTSESAVNDQVVSTVSKADAELSLKAFVNSHE